MDERDETDPLRGLGQRIEKARRAQAGAVAKPANDGGNGGTGAALALGWRIGLELVGAVAVAVFIGWAIDRWLGTRPWGMVVMFFLGVAAGMLNVYRAVAGLGRAVGFQPDTSGNAAADKPGAGWDDDED
jgi:ATP synthase protein I